MSRAASTASTASTASGIYTGTLRHRRYGAVAREFSHPVNFTYLDLDEIPRLAGGRLVDPRPGAWRFRRRDYLGARSVPLDAAVRDCVEAQIGERPGGPVRMLSQLRCFGVCFNPVTLYYCFDAAGEQLLSVVAEVTNTPWRERHAYVLGPFADGRVLRSKQAKQLHVSPFMAMSQRYEIALTAPADTLSVQIDVEGEAGRAFDATLALGRSELTPSALARLIRGDPVAPLRTLGRIYAQGFALKRSRVPVHPHPTRGQA